MNKRLQQIAKLMEVFSGLHASFRSAHCVDRDWRPTTDAEKAAFVELVSLKNRSALKKWYEQCDSLNPTAEQFCRVLEAAIGEPPLLESDRSEKRALKGPTGQRSNM
jgi:hypothetical protein